MHVSVIDLTHLSHELDPSKRTCRAIIETPKGSRNKFAYDRDTHLFRLSGLLPEGMLFPFDFGFVPSTLADDGDPLDVLVLMDAPAHVGCLLQVRLIGVMSATQTEHGKKETNDRLLAASVHSYQHEDLRSMRQVSPTLLSQVEEFFVSYNKQRGKKFAITGTGSRSSVRPPLGCTSAFASQPARFTREVVSVASRVTAQPTRRRSRTGVLPQSLLSPREATGGASAASTTSGGVEAV